MKTVIVRSNQDIYDICIQEFGTIEFLSTLIEDNNLNFDGAISQGQVLLINNQENGNADVKDFFELGKLNSQNGYIFKNDIPVFSFDNDNISFDNAILTWDLIRLTY
ncbi:MAG: hypothetical protein QQN55_01145 [Nitrosopumilus sp.]